MAEDNDKRGRRNEEDTASRQQEERNDRESLKAEMREHGIVPGGSRFAAKDAKPGSTKDEALTSKDQGRADTQGPTGASGPPGSQGKRPERRE